MIRVSCVTPFGQVTIPRSVMTALGIGGGSDLVIKLVDNQIILTKAEKSSGEKEENLICCK